MIDAFTVESFTTYFFGHFACVMVDTTSQNGEFWTEDHPVDFWDSRVLGCFYVLATQRNGTDARSNQIILEGVRMSVTRGTTEICLTLIEKLFSARSRQGPRLRPSSGASVPALCPKVRLSQLDLQPCL